MTWQASTYWATPGWIADVGVYTGPWPPAPPIPAAYDLAAAHGAFEIDWLISVPNPNPAIDPSDGSYPAYDHGVYRYGDVSTHAGHYWGATGGGVDVDALPPGAHIFVIWYGTDPTGLIEPEALVPPLYAAAGTGPPVGDPSTGGWASYTPAPQLTRSADQVPNVGGGRSGIDYPASDHLSGSTGDGDVGVDQAARIASEMSAPPVAGLGTGNMSARFGMFAAKDNHTAPGFHQAGMEAGHLAAARAYDASLDPPTLNAHSLINPLIEGIDYVVVPGRVITDAEPFVDWSAAGPSFAHWEDLTQSVDYGVALGGSYPLRYDTVEFIWSLLSTLPVSGTYPTPGSTLGTYTVDITGPSTGSDTVLLSLSTVTAEYVVICLTSDRFYAGAGPITDFAFPGSGVGDARSAIWDISDFTFSLVGLWDQPDVRWWVPGPPGPVWRTVGGHFATVGGADLKIKTPGVGWVKVVPGT